MNDLLNKFENWLLEPGYVREVKFSYAYYKQIEAVVWSSDSAEPLSITNEFVSTNLRNLLEMIITIK